MSWFFFLNAASFWSVPLQFSNTDSTEWFYLPIYEVCLSFMEGDAVCLTDRTLLTWKNQKVIQLINFSFVTVCLQYQSCRFVSFYWYFSRFELLIICLLPSSAPMHRACSSGSILSTVLMQNWLYSFTPFCVKLYNFSLPMTRKLSREEYY